MIELWIVRLSINGNMYQSWFLTREECITWMIQFIDALMPQGIRLSDVVRIDYLGKANE